MRSTDFIKPEPLNPRSTARITPSEGVPDILIRTVDPHVDDSGFLPCCVDTGEAERLRAPWPLVREG
jgi:hypothetical protein